MLPFILGIIALVLGFLSFHFERRYYYLLSELTWFLGIGCFGAFLAIAFTA